MSYYINLHFKELTKDETFFTVLDNLKKAHLNKAEGIIKDNIVFLRSIGLDERYEDLLASCKDLPDDDKKLLKYTQHLIKTSDDKWLNEILSLKIFIWEKYNLIAVTSPLKNLDGFKRIEFQNSCDQDYEREYWHGISLFDKVVKAEKSLTVDTLRKIMDYQDEDDEAEDYYRKTWIYETIWNTLDLNAWCYGNGESLVFKMFKLNCIDDIYTEAHYSILLRKIKKEYIENENAS